MRKSRGWKVKIKDLKGDEIKENGEQRKYGQIKRQGKADIYKFEEKT